MKILFSFFITIIFVCFTNCDEPDEPDTILSRIEGNVFDSDTGELLDSANVVVFRIAPGPSGSYGTRTIKKTISNAQGFYVLLVSLKNYETYYIGSIARLDSPDKRDIKFVGFQRIDLYLNTMNQ